MRFEIQNKATIDGPTELQLKRAIKSLKSYGSSSFASLTDSDGSYIQVGGGGVTCLVERFDASSGVRQRGYHKPNAAFPDGTISVFGGGQIPMKSDEWFMAGQVVEIFLAYLRTAPEPEYLRWRSAPGF